MKSVSNGIHYAQAFRSVTKTTKEGLQAIAVGSWVVALNFKHFGYESLSRPALDLNNDIQGLCNVRLDGPEWNFDAAL